MDLTAIRELNSPGKPSSAAEEEAEDMEEGEREGVNRIKGWLDYIPLTKQEASSYLYADLLLPMAGELLP